MQERKDSKILNIFDCEFLPYDLDGPVQEEMAYAPLHYKQSGRPNGSWVMKMEPGAVTIPHTHSRNEDFLVVQGELIESDGTVLKPGDFIHYDEGSFHNSRTETGCLLVVFEWEDKPEVWTEAGDSE